MNLIARVLVCAGIALVAPARAETPAEWIALGARVHGAFGAFIPVGIRIGLHAKEKLNADPRGLAVTYSTGAKASCPCIADGVMLATGASPGQGTLVITPEKAPAGVLAVIVVRNRRTGQGLRYAIGDEWLPEIFDWNKTLDLAGRFEAAMNAEGLFQVSPEP